MRRHIPIGGVVVLALASLLGACTSENAPINASTTIATPSASAIPDPFVDLTPPPEPKKMQLPGITSVDAADGQTIKASHSADWTLVAYGTAWITGLGSGVGRFDAATGKRLNSVVVEGRPCAAPDAGFGAVWTATCQNTGVARIDAEGKRVDRVDFNLASNDGESSIGAGEGAVWAIGDAEDFACFACRLVQIDPEQLEVEQSYPIPDGATAVRAGEGGVWVVYTDEDAVMHVDPDTGEIVAAIAVGNSPLFLDVGAGGVWVMNQGDGSVSHIDTTKDEVRATIAVDEFIEGGDLTTDQGSVWLRGTNELVAWIDPQTDTVVARFGKPEGSGSASAGAGQLWISAHDVARVYRIPISRAG